ncbi:MAG: PIN domain-containing protein [bacterium]|nr:PIN domain-containing protein [bacterium]
MKILFDTNVVLDVLLARHPYAPVAAQLLSLADQGRLHGVLCATTVTTIHYLASKAVGHREAQKHVGEILRIFEVAPVTHSVLVDAIGTRFSDCEDAVLHEAARAAGVAGIVTRNARDFERASLPILSPEELLSAVLAVKPTG